MRTGLHADDETFYREEPPAVLADELEDERFDDEFLDEGPDEAVGLDEPFLEAEIRRFRMDR